MSEVSLLSKKLIFFAFGPQQTTDEPPDYSIPAVLSFLDIGPIHICVRVYKQWGPHVREKKRRMKEEALEKRAQVFEINGLLKQQMYHSTVSLLLEVFSLMYTTKAKRTIRH